jgi:transcriptional regulator with XRE-family HTH domain
MAALTSSRKEQGFTQQELAKKIGRPQSFIAKIETGERRLDVVEFTEICVALSIEPVNILNKIIKAFDE